MDQISPFSQIVSRLTNATGVAALPDLAVVEIRGPDAGTFLQGYLTTNTEALSPVAWQPTALCNLKGRVVVTAWGSQPEEGTVRLILHETLCEVIASFLQKYLMFAKSSLAVRTDLTVIAGLHTTLPDGLDAGNGRQFACVTDQATTQSNAHAIPAALVYLDAIHRGDVILTARTSEQFLPQALGLDANGSVDFDKGCYLGQEIVARAQHRGRVKQQPVQLFWQSQETLDSLDNPLIAPDGANGVLVSRAELPGTDCGAALAVVRDPNVPQVQGAVTYLPATDPG